MRDIWLKDERFSELIAFVITQWDDGYWRDFYEPIEENLINNKREKEYIKFWKNILNNRLETLWDWKKEWGKITEFWNGTEKTIESQKFALEGLNSFKKGLELLEAEEEIIKVENLIKVVNKLEKAKPKKTTDKRKIDEDLFWELIEKNRLGSESKYEFIDKLSSQLEDFRPLEIKRFEKTLQTKFQELNHWNVWALAYISNRGCSDDSFDYFKAWVIFKI